MSSPTTSGTMIAPWMVEPGWNPISSDERRMRMTPSAMVACVACVRMTLPEGFSASRNPAYPRMLSRSVIATAMPAVDGSSSVQMVWAASLVMPFFMQSSVWLAKRSIESDWRARTESGSITSRMTITSDNVNTTPAIAMTTMLYCGVASVHTSTMPESTTSVNMSISRLKKRGIAERSDVVLASTSMMPPFASDLPRTAGV